MSDQSTRSYTAIAIAIVVAGALISASVLFAFASASKTVTTTVTTNVTSQAGPLSTAVDGHGLEFLLSLNASQLTTGRALGINVSLTNTLATPNNVTADPGAWSGLPKVSLGPCGTLNEPFGFLIAQGFYSAANASTAVPLTLYKPAYYPCAATLNLSSYTFQPDSYLMNACESGGTCIQIASTSGSSYSGSWSPGGEDLQSAFTPFRPGVYTVFAATEWGQVDVLHFAVSPVS